MLLEQLIQEAVTIDTAKFEEEHHEKPSGEATWTFTEVGGNWSFTGTGNYSTLAATAKRAYSAAKDTSYGQLRLDY